MEENTKNEEKTEKIEKKYEVGNAPIDEDVLEEAKKGIENAVQDEKLLNRMTLNCLCEVLAEIKHLSQSVDGFLNVISICSNEKIVEFFNGVNKNLKKEQAKAEKKAQKSGGGTKKVDTSAENCENIVKFTQKNVK